MYALNFERELAGIYYLLKVFQQVHVHVGRQVNSAYELSGSSVVS